MKRAFVVAAAVGLSLLVATAQSSQAADATSAASGEEAWSVALSGARTDAFVASRYDRLVADSRNAVETSVEKKGVKYAYRGLPLELAIAMIDGPDSAEPFAFDAEAWKSGYTVTLVARDGYTASFSTKDLGPRALIISTTENGKPTPPQVVGDGPKNLWVKDLVAIETSLAPNPVAKAADSFSVDLDVNGTKASFTLKELEASDLYLEKKGSYTTSAGSHYSGLYGGVRIRALLERYAKLSPEDSVKFVATDGYEMSYPGSTLLDEADGTWILAFKLDGDYLPNDPGYVRTIKVGDADPNIDGHLSVRMVKSVVVKQKDYKDFALLLSGKASFTLDRSTVQSCVSCHKRTVTFEKKGVVSTYTGFPAWLALGYVDDPKYAPHRQDKSLPAYESELAKAGYPVDFVAADGFKMTVNAKDLDRNDDIILAMYKNDANLPAEEFPLTLVWDRGAKRLPEGIKNARMISKIEARF